MKARRRDPDMARWLRIAAAVAIAAAIAAAVAQALRWGAMVRGHPVLHDTYVVVDPAGIAGVLILAGFAALVLAALARILDRLDQIRGRLNDDD